MSDGEESIGDGEQEAPAGQHDPLLRAIEELRALERERRAAPFSGRPFEELDRQVEQKAREVFRIADSADDSEPPLGRP